MIENENHTASHLSVIALFTYKKLKPLKLTVSTLQKNRLAAKSKLFIFSDGAANENDTSQVQEVRNFIKKITGFLEVTIYESKENKGLAKSIIQGVSLLLKSHSSVIVLEDDLVTSSNFLDFMNEALDFYKTNEQIHSISGYTMPMKTLAKYPYENYFTNRASSWGWATWDDRWKNIDWEVVDYNEFKTDKKAQKHFNNMGSDLTSMLNQQMNGKISSWAIRWCYNQFRNNTFTVFPLVSKVSNIGFGEEATHTKDLDNRFKTKLDKSGNVNFKFNPKPELNEFYIKQFIAKYSLSTRIFYKLKNLMGL